MPKRFCLDCHQLFDRDATGTQRCPEHQAVADRKRNARAPTASRGYGAAHQRLRQQYVDAFMAGQPCVRCGKPIAHVDDADLGHADGQRGYRGLEHSWCNRGASRRKR